MTSMDDYQRQLNWRLRQIELGKTTTSYRDYSTHMANKKRKREHPSTPDPYDARMSKRQFEGRVKAWKRHINEYNEASRGFGAHGKSLEVFPKLTLFVHSSEFSRLPQLRDYKNTNLVVCYGTDAVDILVDHDWTSSHYYAGIPQ